ncbi:MAG: hypothetical protein QOH05_1395 [Acetobacteraceae bacterium]|nr:hypothetical protein [Acetobacteraceae bacterium]
MIEQPASAAAVVMVAGGLAIPPAEPFPRLERIAGEPALPAVTAVMVVTGRMRPAVGAAAGTVPPVVVVMTHRVFVSFDAGPR